MRRLAEALGGSLLLAVVGTSAHAQDITPRPYSEHRGDLILLDSVVRAERWWLQAGLAAAVYDARRDVVIGRFSPAMSGGYRFGRLGVFGVVEYDQTVDFTIDTDHLHLLNLGVGIELLQFLGHVRSALAVGASVLLDDTLIDEAGETGWFVDLRPGSLRWGFGEDFAVEVAPLAFDVVAPVTQGLPLVVFSYTTVLSVEWSAP